MQVPVKVQNVLVDLRSTAYVVVLKELDGDRIVPILVGTDEAAAIAQALYGLEIFRPRTHELLRTVIETMGGTLNKVLISSLDSDSYRGELTIRSTDGVLLVDARASDSLALALRAKTPIFASDDILRSGESTGYASGEQGAEAEQSGSSGRTEPLSPEELLEHLQKLRPEDFGRFTP